MEGIEDVQRSFLDVDALAGELLAPGQCLRVSGWASGLVVSGFDDGELFPSRRGRTSVPASVIGSVLVLQALEGHTARGTAEALTFDRRWKAACGYGLNETAFHPTTLTYWRKRLAENDRPHRITEAVFEIV